jgi:hypothetical protein
MGGSVWWWLVCRSRGTRCAASCRVLEAGDEMSVGFGFDAVVVDVESACAWDEAGDEAGDAEGACAVLYVDDFAVECGWS